LIFSSDGTALFTYLSRGTPNNFAVSRSRDGGRTWSAPIFVPGGLYDRQFLVEDASSESRHRGRIYALGKVNLSRLSGPAFQAIAVSDSTDGGETFSPPRLFVPPDDNDPLWIVAGAMITRTGKIVLPFATVIRPKQSDATLHYTLWTTESTDGGRVFSSPRLVTPRVILRGNVQKYVCVPSMAIDRSGGPHDGWMYLTWSLPRDGGYAIQVWRSEDNGGTWLPGVTVNDNPRPSGHVNPAVAVNGRGELGVAWYDRRGDREGNCHRLFTAASTDGGATFSVNMPATQQETCVSPGRWANAGDTLGLASDASGRFHSVFISGRDSSAMQLYDASFTVNAAGRR
ncbi:MAG: sialidase family protein, partial [Gammaproteobacteria bacterium]